MYKTRNVKDLPISVVVGLSVNALGVIRSLGRKSIKVIAIGSDRSEYAAKSRYCKTLFCNRLYGEELYKKLLEIGNSLNQKGVLFCTSDMGVLTVSQYENELRRHYHFVFPSKETINMLMSKRLFYEFASKNRFNVPKTFFVDNKEDIQMVSNLIHYPCVIKPEFRDESWDRNVSKVDKIMFIKSKDEYCDFFNQYNISNIPLIVQEWIDGTDADVFYGLTYINQNQQPLAVFTGRKIRQFPVLTGSTSLAESKWDAYVAEESIRLLNTANCIGICSVEFKYSRKDKVYMITEPTVGRTDTQEGSSINSGIDIPYIAYLDAIGDVSKPSIRFNEGIKWINEPEDFSSILTYFKNGNIDIKQLISSYHGKRTYALKAIDDPLPFLDFIGKKFIQGIQKLLKTGIKIILRR